MQMGFNSAFKGLNTLYATESTYNRTTVPVTVDCMLCISHVNSVLLLCGLECRPANGYISKQNTQHNQ
jgi:hypothetical protein